MTIDLSPDPANTQSDPGRPIRVAVRSVGCRTNQQEIEQLTARFAADGVTVVESVREADIVVVNTCAVTSVAEGKSRRLISQIEREAPRARVVVTGCLAQLSPQLFDDPERPRWIVGNDYKDSIPRIVSNEPGVYVGTADSSLSARAEPFSAVSRARIRYGVKIQEGCDYRCAYCIVPLARGRARSAPARTVIETVRNATAAGVREIVLTGTHIGQYRDDGVGLTELVGELSALDSDFRLRLSSLDPRDLNAQLLALVASAPRVCRHLHVSVQSLTQPVLDSMGRGACSAREIIDTLGDFRRKYPSVALGGDFIVGFPGESDTLFAQTMESVEKAGFTYGHVFRYSPRAGTAAPDFPDQIPQAVAQQRSRALSSALELLNRRFCDCLIGTHERVIIEKTRPLTGITGNYIRVQCSGESIPRGQWCTVEIGGRVDGKRPYCRAEVCL